MRATSALPLSLLLALPLLAGACGDDDDAGSGADGGGGQGTVAVHLEPLDGVLIEGFELGLRFETADGEVLDQRLWSEFVAGTGDPSIDAFYDSVLEAEVPAGTVVVLANLVQSIGGPIEPPDLSGEMPCSLEVDVPEGGTVEVEVSFSGEPDCMTVTS